MKRNYTETESVYVCMVPMVAAGIFAQFGLYGFSLMFVLLFFAAIGEHLITLSNHKPKWKDE